MTLFKKALGGLFYLLGFFFFISGLYLQFSKTFLISETRVLLLFACVCGCFSIATLLLYSCFESVKKKQRIVRLFLIITFLYYILTVLNLLLFSIYFGRQNTSELSYSYYFHRYTNFIPFLTTRVLWEGWKNGQLALGYVLFNYIGNLAVFMPMGFFLPALFHKMKKFIWFFLTISITVIFLESMQFVLRVGSCDIDDLIFNVIGACILFFILKVPFIRKKLHTFHVISNTKLKSSQ